MFDSKTIFQRHSLLDFDNLALELFRFQAVNCRPYSEYLSNIGIDCHSITAVEEIPFLPIELFKSHNIYSSGNPPDVVFSSSSTSGQVASKHAVSDISIYEESFVHAFELFYGKASDMAIFALLPSYLERSGSSLIYMVDRLIAMGPKGIGGFYLHDYEKLLHDMEAYSGQKILLGVSYALWDLAEAHPTALKNCIVMETGGMKGHRVELPRDEFHKILNAAFEVDNIHSEYSMAELLSQAYSSGEGLFATPPWMRIMIRDLNDPRELLPANYSGGVNIIDLANIYSCSFIQTRDLGRLHDDGTFSILGRITGSEIRGCNLLVQ